MKPRRARGLRLLGAGAVALVAAVAANGITASNTVTAKDAGDGSDTISGYTISSVGYTLNGSNPSNLDAVTFNTDRAATTVKIKLVAAGSDWYACATTNNPTNTAWSCDTTVGVQATVAAADELKVVAVE